MSPGGNDEREGPARREGPLGRGEVELRAEREVVKARDETSDGRGELRRRKNRGEGRRDILRGRVEEVGGREGESPNREEEVSLTT